MLGYVFPSFFGFVAGLVAGFALVYLVPKEYLPALGYQYAAGGVVGAIFGAVIGSITGDSNATSDQGSHRLLIAGVFGLVGGCLGCTRLDAVWVALRHFNWTTPI